MMTVCVRWVLLVVGIVLLVAALLPVSSILPIPDEYQTAFISAKLLMLPIGACCVGGAAALSARSSRRRLVGRRD